MEIFTVRAGRAFTLALLAAAALCAYARSQDIPKAPAGTRGLVKKPIRIAITESGVTEDKFRTPGLYRDKLLYEEFIEREKKVFTRLKNQLRDGDILLNQVLYTDFKKGHEANFHPDFRGITHKAAILAATEEDGCFMVLGRFAPRIGDMPTCRPDLQGLSPEMILD